MFTEVEITRKPKRIEVRSIFFIKLKRNNTRVVIFYTENIKSWIQPTRKSRYIACICENQTETSRHGYACYLVPYARTDFTGQQQTGSAVGSEQFWICDRNTRMGIASKSPDVFLFLTTSRRLAVKPTNNELLFVGVRQHYTTTQWSFNVSATDRLTSSEHWAI